MIFLREKKEGGGLNSEFGIRNSELFLWGFWSIIDLILGKEENVGMIGLI